MYFNKILILIALLLLILINITIYYIINKNNYEFFTNNNEDNNNFIIESNIYLDETSSPDETNNSDESNSPDETNNSDVSNNYDETNNSDETNSPNETNNSLEINETKKILNNLDDNINNKKISIDLLACSNTGSLILLVSNKDNLMYISKNNGENWIYKKLPEFIEYSKIYLIELNINNYLLVLFGKNSGIYISTSLGDIWKLISFNKGNDLCYSNNLDYIYIATNVGILYNNNQLNITRNECDTECLTNYNMYEGEFKFNIINRDEIINKNITNIQCIPDGNIIVYSIDNNNLFTIKYEKNKWNTMSGLTWEKIGYDKPVNHKEIVNKELSELLKMTNIITLDQKNKLNLNDVVEKSYIQVDNIYYKPININKISDIKNVKNIIILEDQLFGSDGNILVNDDSSLYLYNYKKNDEEKLITKKQLVKINIEDSICAIDNGNCLIKINNLIRYKIATKYSFILVINNNMLLCNNINKSDSFLPIKKLNNIYIKDIITNKNGSKGIFIDYNGNIYINNDLQNYFKNKSEFEKVSFDFKNSF